MNYQIKNIILKTGLFEEDPDCSGMYFAHKSNYDAQLDLEKLVKEIADEYVQAIRLWKESSDETNGGEYVKGYEDACIDILEEIKERFK